MNVAVVLTSRLDAGGGFQHELASVQAIAKSTGPDDYCFHFVTNRRENVKVLAGYGIECRYVASSIFDRLFRSLKKRNSLWCKLFHRLGRRYSDFEKCLLSQDIDIAYFLSPSQLAAELVATNFIITVWDLCHRDHPEFPEVNFGNEFERRESLYMKVLTKSVAIIVDSAAGKENTIRRYHVDRHRVHVSPFLVSEAFNRESVDERSQALDIKGKYNLKGDYIYYPAQFWPHKNHVYILEALNILKKDHGIRLHALFSGSDKGNLNLVLDKARSMGIADLVSYIGFVEESELPCLYRQALALVMPTYFGPTNIPPLEAFSLGCPVVYPDLAGLREQVGDAAYMMDLKRPESLVEQLLFIMNNPQDVDTRRTAGYVVVNGWKGDDYLCLLRGILDDYAIKMKNWK